MSYIISQALGVIGIFFAVASMQSKNIKSVLLCQIGCNALGMLSYVLLGGLSGSGIYMIALVQSVIFCIIRQKGKEEPKWLSPVVVAAYIVCSAFAFQGAIDVLPILAAILCAIALIQKKPSNYRIAILLNGAVWLAYDMAIGAYAMLASHGITVIAALIGIVRLDVLKKEK